jgi:hypothetical protein
MTAIFAIAGFLVPAYWPDAPRGLSVLHSQNEAGKARWSVRGSDRLLSLEIEYGDTDVLDIGLSEDSLRVSSVAINGVMHEQAASKRVRCNGRSCKTVVYETKVNADAKNVSIALSSYRYGLGPENQTLLKARPDWALPQHRRRCKSTKESY